MTIYSKPIDDITFADVIGFLEQRVPESVVLDYKRDFPKDLAKSICAFSNTFGGTILIGVEEEDGKPKPPFEGIDSARGNQERIVNLCLDSLYPPLVPEVAVASQDGKSFVVIRIPQSINAPHSIQSNTQAYVRTGNRNSPETLISYERHQWLSNRRENSVSFRQKLLQSARGRHENLVSSTSPYWCQPTIELFASPVYPRDPIAPTPDFLILQAKTFLTFPHVIVFPSNNVRLRPIDQGMYAFDRITQHDLVAYFELTQFGSAFLSRNLNWKSPQSDRRDVIYTSRLVAIVAHFFDTISAVYDFLQYNGYSHTEVRLTNIINTELIPINSSMIVGPKNLTEASIERTLVLHPHERSTREARDSLVAEALCSICWALGEHIEQSAMIDMIQSVRR